MGEINGIVVSPKFRAEIVQLSGTTNLAFCQSSLFPCGAESDIKPINILQNLKFGVTSFHEWSSGVRVIMQDFTSLWNNF